MEVRKLEKEEYLQHLLKVGLTLEEAEKVVNKIFNN